MTWFFQNEDENKFAFLDADGNQVLETVAIIAAQMSPSVTFSQHKLENGMVVTDNKIVNQTLVSVQIILQSEDYVEIYNEIKTLYEATTNFTLMDRVDFYDDMYLEDMPHEESADIANTIALTLNFRQQQFASVTTGALTADDVEEPADVDTTSSGSKSSVESEDTVLQSLSKKFGITS